jgi:hypothetical protein
MGRSLQPISFPNVRSFEFIQEDEQISIWGEEFCVENIGGPAGLIPLSREEVYPAACCAAVYFSLRGSEK